MIRRRSWFSRLLRVPGVFLGHYRITRSLRGAAAMAILLIRPLKILA